MWSSCVDGGPGVRPHFLMTSHRDWEMLGVTGDIRLQRPEKMPTCKVKKSQEPRESLSWKLRMTGLLAFTVITFQKDWHSCIDTSMFRRTAPPKLQRCGLQWTWSSHGVDGEGRGRGSVK